MSGARTVLRSIFAVLFATALLGSCATRIPVNVELAPESGAYEAVVRLPFVTNRSLTDDGGERYYGNDQGELSAGYCDVGFPPGERDGDILRVDTADLRELLARLPGEPSQRVVIYVHGYSESFEKNCRRAALLQHRLRLDGRFVLFSWPSSNYLTYSQDAGDLEHSLEQLNEILSLVEQSVGGERIILMAHSMGSRGIVNALKKRSDDTAAAGKLHSAVFIAPDIRRETFVETADMLLSRVSGIAVYMSDNDRVLWLSTTVNVSGRLGVAGDIAVNDERIEIVDISRTGTSEFTGHLYHLYNPAVIEDLQALLGSAPASQQRKYHRVAGGRAGVWALEALPSKPPDTKGTQP